MESLCFSGLKSHSILLLKALSSRVDQLLRAENTLCVKHRLYSQLTLKVHTGNRNTKKPMTNPTTNDHFSSVSGTSNLITKHHLRPKETPCLLGPFSRPLGLAPASSSHKVPPWPPCPPSFSLLPSLGNSPLLLWPSLCLLLTALLLVEKSGHSLQTNSIDSQTVDSVHFWWLT